MSIRYDFPINNPLITGKDQGWHSIPSNGQLVHKPYKRGVSPQTKVQHSFSLSTLYIHSVKNSLIFYFDHWLDRWRNLHRISFGLLFDLLTVVADLPRVKLRCRKGPIDFWHHQVGLSAHLKALELWGTMHSSTTIKHYIAYCCGEQLLIRNKVGFVWYMVWGLWCIFLFLVMYSIIVWCNVCKIIVLTKI